MTNAPEKEVGLWYMGIANDEYVARNWENTYRKTAVIYGNHYVVGIENKIS